MTGNLDFLYDKVKAHKGLAWYPLIKENNELQWKGNLHYQPSELIIKEPEDYFSRFGIEKKIPIYSQFEKDPERFQFVSKPGLKEDVWKKFIP